MKHSINTIAAALITSTILLASHTASAGVADQMLNEYIQQGAKPSALAGETLWNREFVDAKSGKNRSCASCHTSRLTQTGEHVKTGKVIKPMAPSVNPKRFTKVKKVNKWFKRNCKWTLGRECTLQEKADVLAYIRGK